MQRHKPARALLAALTTVLLTAAALTTAPASLAAAGDYPDQTSGAVRGMGLLREVFFALDPTEGLGDIGAALETPTQDEEYLVVTLGDLSGTTCTPQWQLVVSGNDSDVLVRRAGADDLPPAEPAGDGPSGSFARATRLHGYVPTCASAELQDTKGAVLDSLTIPVEAKQAPTQHLRTAYDSVYQVAANTTSVIESQILPNRYGLDAVLYDGSWRLTHDSMVAVVDDRQALTEVGGRVDTVIQPAPGLHTLTATVSGGNADTSAQTFTVYAPGAQPPARTGNLAGRTFATGEGAISFVDRRFAYVGVPPRGRPHCTAAKVHVHSLTGCLRYEWNVASNLLQIGDWIGAPDRAPSSGRAVRGTFWHRKTYCQDFGYPHAGLRLSGEYSLTTSPVATEDGAVPRDRFHVRFTRTGHFRLDVAQLGAAAPSHHHGTYSVSRHGLLLLTLGRKHVVGTIGVHLTAAGTQAPGRGLVLGLDSIREGVHGSFRAGSSGFDDSTARPGSAPATWTPGRFGGRSCT